MIRRSFLTVLGGAAAWPLVARAQQPAVPVIGFLSSGSPRAFAGLAEAFREGLQQQGFLHGNNVQVEYRWAEGRYDELPKLAADLVQRRVRLIAATGGVISARAAKAATTEIPIVFIVGFDPVKLGLVESFNSPGGNATGVNIFTTELAIKRLQLLKDLLPRIDSVAILVNPGAATTDIEIDESRQAAHRFDLKFRVFEANTEGGLDAALERAAQDHTGALLVSADPFFTAQRNRIVALAGRLALPAMYPLPVYVEAGGLVSYGAKLSWAYRQIGIYAGRILKGAKPNELPVQLPTEFDLALNLKAAKALNMTIPTSTLVRASHVVE